MAVHLHPPFLLTAQIQTGPRFLQTKGTAALFHKHLSLKFLKRHALVRSLQQPQVTVLKMTVAVRNWQHTSNHRWDLYNPKAVIISTKDQHLAEKPCFMLNIFKTRMMPFRKTVCTQISTVKKFLCFLSICCKAM